MTIKIKDLELLKNVFNLKVLIAEAGLVYGTIDSKIRRQTKLNTDESEAISEALIRLGITIDMKKLSKFEKKESA